MSFVIQTLIPVSVSVRSAEGMPVMISLFDFVMSKDTEEDDIESMIEIAKLFRVILDPGMNVYSWFVEFLNGLGVNQFRLIRVINLKTLDQQLAFSAEPTYSVGDKVFGRHDPDLCIAHQVGSVLWSSRVVEQEIQDLVNIQ
jgi:hypothetical protein